MNGNTRTAAPLLGPKPGMALEDSVDKGIELNPVPSGVRLAQVVTATGSGINADQLVLQYLGSPILSHAAIAPRGVRPKTCSR